MALGTLATLQGGCHCGRENVASSCGIEAVGSADAGVAARSEGGPSAESGGAVVASIVGPWCAGRTKTGGRPEVAQGVRGGGGNGRRSGVGLLDPRGTSGLRGGRSYGTACF